ncbi:MAG: RNA polymerase factor sigma-54, partial [Myxococcaceae bacterium]
MAMELKQSLRLTQTLVMTPQLQQAIKLLQLSRMELLETVREEMETNPLIEQPDETADGNIDEKAPGEASLEAANAEGPSTEALEAKVPERAEEVKGEGPAEIDWDAYFNSYQFNEPTTASNKNNVATEDLPSFEANLVEREDLSRHLETQLGFLKLNDAEIRVASLILGNLDDDGYLKLPDVEGDPLIRLAAEADVSVVLAERTLRKIHQLDPKGCGARDLQECLLIQAAALKDNRSQLLSLILKRHLKLLESKNLPAIAREMKLTLAEVVDASKLLAKLDPKPGRNWSGEDAQYITPDVFVYKLGEEYTVVL